MAPPKRSRNWYSKLQYSNLFITLVLPLAALYCSLYIPWRYNTVVFSVIYYNISMTSFVAGYHRLWAHHSFQSIPLLSYFYGIFGSSCALGSIKHCVGVHRAHHRYIDTEKDPHSVRKGVIWSHIAWLWWKPHFKVINSIRECQGDDLNDWFTVWQDENYIGLTALTCAIIPSFICGLWGDYIGGLIVGGVLRGFIAQQSILLVNSAGHTLGTRPYDDRRSMRNNWLLSLFTYGEGMNNFHHEFANDYRNGIHWYDFDPVKWQLYLLSVFGLVKLHRVSNDSITQCLLQQQQKLIDQKRSQLNWGIPIEQLPIITPQEFKRWAKDDPGRALIAVAGIIHDVSPFINDHPGGAPLIRSSIGKDATSAFNGAVYAHSTAAHNLLATMRIAVLDDEQVWRQRAKEDKNVPWKQDSKGHKIIRTGEQDTIVKKPKRTADAA
jgi:stearoyl-CoA desaturase (delta-9 desaturase)